MENSKGRECQIKWKSHIQVMSEPSDLASFQRGYSISDLQPELRYSKELSQGADVLEVLNLLQGF